MMSSNAVAAIRRLFEQSLRENCISGPNDECLISDSSGMAPFAERDQHQVVVLNISSYAFRIVALFEFNEDAETSAHLARISHREVRSLQRQDLLDAYSEFVNLICGKVNRDLGKVIFHSGLSTPFFLESTCAQYLSVLKPSNTHILDAVVNHKVHFRLTVCICAADDISIDFQVDQTAHEETTTGEMEMF